LIDEERRCALRWPVLQVADRHFTTGPGDAGESDDLGVEAAGVQEAVVGVHNEDLVPTSDEGVG
jgi:hypothetical protein